MQSTWVLVDLVAAFLFFKIIRILFFSRASRALPPGPKPWPIIGNLFDVPLVAPHRVYADWRHKYGDLIYLDCFGVPFYTLNSLEDSLDLFEKQGAHASSRPNFPMSADILGWGQFLVLQQYGEPMRYARRLLKQHIGAKGQLESAVRTFGELEERKNREALMWVLKDPDNLQGHIRRTAGAIILEMAYGYDVNGGKDELVDEIEEAMISFNMSCVVGTFLVDFIPALKYIPSWVPGAGWKRKAKKWRAQTEAVIHRPYDLAMERMANNTAIDSFVTQHHRHATNARQEYVLRTTAASLYSGGADTSVSTIYSFVLAMVLYPKVQRKAQQELDTVVGNDRLPTFEDRDRLPYVCALVSEVYRWMPVVPLTIRETTEDTTCKGYLIPKGSMVQANIWHFLHDAEFHENPEEFRPERFIKTATHEPERDPRLTVFGFGRRMCPGLNIAELSIFIACAMYLSVFDISKAVIDGVEVTPTAEVVTGIINHPKPFQCSIKPRSAKAEALILAAAKKD